MNKSFIIANITWNPTGWRNTYINPKAGHSYARTYSGHEALNFKFDKKGIDTDKHIYGYVQWKSKPKNFCNGGTIIFYSKNTDTNKGMIVGIYSNVEILDASIKKYWKGFQRNRIEQNIRAEKAYSILFPISLDANNYKKDKGKRLVGQIGYSYYDINKAKQIIIDELLELSKSGIQEQEFRKLKYIYSYITGEDSFVDLLNKDEIEQNELICLYKNKKSEIINELKNLKPTDDEIVTVRRKSYKRDNKTIAQLKILRDFKCQICNNTIHKKDGGFYIEAAHIVPKHQKGRETPDNILILCPNHHKEFDYGKKIMKGYKNGGICFKLNNKEYTIDLSIE